jgi:hypothetical protein
MIETPTPPEPGFYASHPLDILLRDWRDSELPTGTEDYLAEEHPEHPEANARLVAAELGAYRAFADLIDAFRAHPDLTYADGRDRLYILLDELPDPAAPIPTPSELVLTLRELAALESGDGDRPVRSRR